MRVSSEEGIVRAFAMFDVVYALFAIRSRVLGHK
jgi:hypothetical protein